jgi:hypothetical protein
MVNLGAIIWKLFIEANYITSIFLSLDTCEFVFLCNILTKTKWNFNK